VGIFVVGGTYICCISGFNTVAQLRAPPKLRGRVMGFNLMILGTLYPLGAVVQGAVADEIGLRATTTIAAVVLGGAIFVIRLVRPGFDAHLDDVARDAAVEVPVLVGDDLAGEAAFDAPSPGSPDDPVGAAPPGA